MISLVTRYVAQWTSDPFQTDVIGQCRWNRLKAMLYLQRQTMDGFRSVSELNLSVAIFKSAQITERQNQIL